MRNVTPVVVTFIGLFCLGCAEETPRPALSLYVMYPQEGQCAVGVADMVNNAVVFGRWQFNLTVQEISPCQEGGACIPTEEAHLSLARVFENRPDDPQLLVTVGDLYAPLLETRHCDFFGTKVLHLDGHLNGCRDLRTVTYRTFGPAFLAGVAAARQLTEDNAAGRFETPVPLQAGIIATDNPLSQAYIDGFAEGFLSGGGEVLDRHIVQLDADTDRETRASKARNSTRSLLEQGLRLILAADGTVGVDISTEAWTTYIDDNNRFADSTGDIVVSPMYVIGVDTDLNMINSLVMLGSIVKHYDHTVREAMYEVAGGTFAFGATDVGFGDGSTEFLYNPSIHLEEVEDAVIENQSLAQEAAASYYRDTMNQ